MPGVYNLLQSFKYYKVRTKELFSSLGPKEHIVQPVYNRLPAMEFAINFPGVYRQMADASQFLLTGIFLKMYLIQTGKPTGNL